jgi:heme/copper-type cytochrome/quinol oxidase subunit 2
VFSEYEKLCGIQHGGSRRQIVALTQEQLAKELGADVRTLQRLKKLQALSPDLQELI